MPSPREVEYWEGCAEQLVTEHAILADNVWKRPHQVRRLLEYDFLGESVLEIGVGNGLVAGAIKVALHGQWSYRGTELSEHFRRHAKASFNLDTVQADVCELPDGPFSRIIALDSLEHVRPQDRPQGYERIAAVAAPDALLFIHYSNSPSHHNKEFDHPFGLDDLVALERVGFRLKRFENYRCAHPKVKEPLEYVFVVMQR